MLILNLTPTKTLISVFVETEQNALTKDSALTSDWESAIKLKRCRVVSQCTKEVGFLGSPQPPVHGFSAHN